MSLNPEPIPPLPNDPAVSGPKKPVGRKANWTWLLAGIAVLAVIIFAGLTWNNANLAPQPTSTPVPPTATAAPAPGATMLSDKDGMTLVYVPEGKFLMGSTDADTDAQADEKPQHTVYLDAFWIDRTEVTQGMYAKCAAAGKCDQSASSDGDNFPVRNVTWNQAAAYCAWAGGRLPTEAQWEKAARGTDGRIYPWGNQAPTKDLSNFFAHEGYVQEVGSYPAGASPYGALDMGGNVWEWTADWYGETYYSESPDRNPTGPTSGMIRVLRGGFGSNKASSVRSAYRFSNVPDAQVDSYGIRCVR